MRQKSIVIIGLTVIAAIFIAFFYFKNLRGIWPLLKPVPGSVPAQNTNTLPNGEGKNLTGLPLKIPPGFSISVFAENLPGARVIAFDYFGNMWVSQPSEGIVSLIEIDKDTGASVRTNPVFKNLKKPHGLALDPKNGLTLYIAEEDKISKVGLYSEDSLHKIADLPAGEGHSTRTIGFGPDGRLYVSIGSSCNVCNETDDRRAKIFSMNKDGSDFKEYARGLRNAVFFTWHQNAKSADWRMWVTEMGRDLLGDDIPPDEINIIDGPSASSGQNSVQNFGWPICYGKNIHDMSFDKNTYFRNPCMEPFEMPSFIDIPAHSAPLGLAFVPNPPVSGWPEGYKNDLLAAYHGSWNRNVPTGYKLVRHKFGDDGAYVGVEDFITGWQSGSDVYGRPVDLVFSPLGDLFVTDDRRGLVYKISYVP